MNARKFKKVCYSVCRKTNHHVVGFTFREYTPNFDVCEISSRRGESKYLLCSEDGEWGLSSYFEPMDCELHLIDDEELATQLRELFGIELLPAKFADRECIFHWIDF